jgi:UDP-N-acetylglucosamine acyltransferase
VIHPSAIVHPSAQLAECIEIGPGAIVEAGARIGPDCVIQAHAFIGGHVSLGAGNLVGFGAIVGADPQDFAFRPEIQSEVRIGDRNRLREYCTIHRGTAEGSATVIGDDCFLMGGTHLAHNVRLGNRVITANNVLLGGHVLVEEGVFIGGGCVFHQHIRVGRLAICQGASAFSKDIPPYTLAAERNTVAGLNVVGLRRAGLDSAQRKEIKSAFNLLYRDGLNTAQALASAASRTWSPEARVFWDFVSAAKKRGLCALLGDGSSDQE